MLKRLQSPGGTLGRYADRWTCHALAQVGSQRQASPRQVHQVRVSIKRLRAMWRLLAPLADANRRQAQNQALRDAAASLASARDAHVSRQTLLGLARHHPSHASALRHMAERLPVTEAPGNARVPMKTVHALRQAAVALHAAVAAVPHWDDVEKAFDRLRHRARRDREDAKDHLDDAEVIHDWRKRCKDLYYAVEMLPLPLRRRHDKLRKMLRSANALLGHDHDLVVLDSLLAQMKPADKPDAAALRQARRVIAKRLTRLRRQTIKLTRKL